MHAKAKPHDTNIYFSLEKYEESQWTIVKLQKKKKNYHTPPVLFMFSNEKTAPDLDSSDTEECDIRM